MASILAVDDSISVRQMLTITLRNAGHDVIAAADGAEALQIALKYDFDLVITDLHMPRMNGICLVSELRNLPAFENTPLFLLTSEASAERKQACREAGASGWIEKPVGANQLRTLVGNLLNREAD